jgi:hypothetical protein
LESFWHLLQRPPAEAAALIEPEGAWDDPLFNRAEGAAGIAVAFARFRDWYQLRGLQAPTAIHPLRTTADARRVVVETILDMKDGLTWNQAEQKAERAEFFQLAAAVVGDRSARTPGLFTSIRIYFGTWSVLNGAPKVRVGPIAPDEPDEVRAALEGMPIIRRYFECLAAGREEISDLFEPDGHFREPANNYACGTEQLRGHFSHILKLGGVGIEFRTATREGDRLALELQTVKWGSKKMAQPQAGFASYELGAHGKLSGARVYDSVVPPEF